MLAITYRAAYFAYGLILLLCIPVSAYSYIVSPLNRLDCKLATPKVIGKAYPGRDKINPFNKLAIPPGKAVYAKGEILHLMGRVYDKDCVPVEGAVIELWQRDSAGKYRWVDVGDLVSPDAVFAGTGRAVSNNIGEYKFITVFPGVKGKEAPHLNIRVTHPDFPTLTTKIYFAGDRRNDDDKTLRRIKSPRKELLMATVIPSSSPAGQYHLQAFFDIILAGKGKYRQF